MIDFVAFSCCLYWIYQEGKESGWLTTLDCFFALDCILRIHLPGHYVNPSWLPVVFTPWMLSISFTYQTLSSGAHAEGLWVTAAGPIVHHLVHEHHLSCFLWLTAQLTFTGLWKHTHTHTAWFMQMYSESEKNIRRTQREDNTHLNLYMRESRCFCKCNLST